MPHHLRGSSWTVGNHRRSHSGNNNSSRNSPRFLEGLHELVSTEVLSLEVIAAQHSHQSRAAATTTTTATAAYQPGTLPWKERGWGQRPVTLQAWGRKPPLELWQE
mmetsp:Transcript_50555/g.109090  ORF Transcript_50555/g.109090 Transcript_50555/m.109090 type:complete len:106 (+) Transcript_50555:1274-1591(+)